MRRVSRLASKVLIISAFALSLYASAAAQNREQYVISAKAGRVNLVSGTVMVQRQLKVGEPVTPTSELDTGDTVRTSWNGRLEVLLNPGSYVRVGGNSELELTNASLDDLQLRLVSGSAIIEATGTGGTRLLAQISTPQARIAIDRNGLYRINALPNGTTEVLVSKGEALVGHHTLTKVKGGKKAVIGQSGVVEVAKFDRKIQDDFGSWSKQRAEELVRANRRLTESTVASAFASFRRSGAFGYGYAPYFGLWVYDRFLGCYTFLPFYDRWSSPYGFGYNNGFGLPWYYYRPARPRAPSTGPGGGTIGTGPAPAPGGAPIRSPGVKAPRDGVDPDPIVRRPRPLGGADRFDRDFGIRPGSPDPGVGDFGRSNKGPSENGAPSAPVQSAPVYAPPASAPPPAPPVRNDPVDSPARDSMSRPNMRDQ